MGRSAGRVGIMAGVETPETPAAWAKRTCKEQHLPVKVTDPEVLKNVAVLLRTSRKLKRAKRE